MCTGSKKLSSHLAVLVVSTFLQTSFLSGRNGWRTWKTVLHDGWQWSGHWSQRKKAAISYWQRQSKFIKKLLNRFRMLHCILLRKNGHDIMHSSLEIIAVWTNLGWEAYNNAALDREIVIFSDMQYWTGPLIKVRQGMCGTICIPLWKVRNYTEFPLSGILEKCQCYQYCQTTIEIIIEMGVMEEALLSLVGKLCSKAEKKRLFTYMRNYWTESLLVHS